MSNYVNWVVVRAPGIGTTSRTFDPASTGTVLAGAFFTPTAGRALVCEIQGGVTCTTPAGWTLPAGGGQASLNGIYVFHKMTAAGGDTLTTTHNGTNYENIIACYEYLSGTTFGAAAGGTGYASGSAGPNMTGATGTNDWHAINSIAVSTANVTWTVATETYDFTATGGGDTSKYGGAELENSASTSFNPTVSYTSSWSAERVAYRLKPTIPSSTFVRPTVLVPGQAVHRASRR